MGYDLGTATGTIKLRYDGSTSIKSAVTDLSTLRSTLQATGLAGRSVSRLLTAGIGVAIATGIGLAVNAAAEFEKQISAIASVSNATGEQLDQLRAKALQLGADTVFSASDAAQAMEELVKAGLSVDDVLNGAADAAVALAAAGGIDIPAAATLAANAMNQFNLAASDLPHVADLIAGTANASAIGVADLGQALQQAGAVANLTGLSFEDTAAAIGLMGNAGIRGSDAGTSLKTMLQNLIPQTTKQIDLFQQLGLLTEDGANKFFDATGSVKSYAQIANVLQEALKGQTREQELATLQTIFGSDAIRAAAITANAGAKGVKNFTNELESTTAAEVAAKRMDNFSGSMEQLSGSVQTLAIEIGSPLLVPLRFLVDLLTEGTNILGDAATVVGGELAPGFQDLGDAAQNTLDFLGKLFDLIVSVGQIPAALGLGAAVLLFNTLADVLSKVTGFLDDHEAMVIAVAGAYLILSGAAAQAAGSLAAMAASGLLAVLNGLARMVGASAAATRGVGSLTGALNVLKGVGIAAVIYAAVSAWQAYRAGVEQAKAAQDDINDSIKEGTLQSLSDASAQGDKFVADWNARADALVGKTNDLGSEVGHIAKTVVTPWNWDDLFNTAGQAGAIDDIERQSQAAEDAFNSQAGAIVNLAQSLKLINPDEVQQLMLLLETGDPKGIAEAQALLEKMGPQLDAAGVSIAQVEEALTHPFNTAQSPFQKIILQIQALNTDAGKTTAASDDLVTAFTEIEGGALSAADAADALDAALNNLIGDEIGAQEAAIKFRNDLRDLENQIDKNNKTLKGNSAAADENKHAIDGLVSDLLDQLNASAKAGVGADKLALQMRQGRKDIVAHAVALGFNRKELNAYLDTLNLTPEEVNTIVDAVGAETAKQQMKDLQDQYNLTPKEVKSIVEAAGAKTAADQVKALRDYINQLHDAHVNITTTSTFIGAHGVPTPPSSGSGGGPPIAGPTDLSGGLGGTPTGPRRRGGGSTGGAQKVATGGGATIVTNIYNPTVREASDDVTRRLTLIAQTGLLGGN